ncbi:hypothetical protein SARC_05523 [Sphaeroforma arctica JP610]|uniref:Uncharacterized protein n=1 Tax=Sphaeroforma arctica JP610 TaxID=667725 RepID=A0A0L0G012_9EUKA|nr:hypothetical protein SARC_05523 [Sphaeroforma arctica JP610]KNC82184.1 hypothetical protein SARC_05523 [Sphaeroforma arctica JP610]|eukprot:XP_014156086.1 hypothetical protein SARC_05523 [Sphaeroforma arctica JP610]
MIFYQYRSSSKPVIWTKKNRNQSIEAKPTVSSVVRRRDNPDYLKCMRKGEVKRLAICTINIQRSSEIMDIEHRSRHDMPLNVKDMEKGTQYDCDSRDTKSITTHNASVDNVPDALHTTLAEVGRVAKRSLRWNSAADEQ